MKTLQVGDFSLLVGETAQENWDLIDQARKLGWFFHLTDFPSPYVVLECGKVEPNAHIKLRCAEICVEHSKHKNAGKVKVDVTPVANVKVDKKDLVGECDYKNEGKVEILVVQTGKKAAAEAGDDGKSRGKGKERAGKGSKGYADCSQEAANTPDTASGNHVSLLKSPNGFATVTFIDAGARNAVLREFGDSGIAIKSGVTVKLLPQIDQKTKEEVPTAIFASWGRKVEEKVPVSEAELLRCFEEIARRASVAVAKAAPSQANSERVSVRKAAAGGVAVLSFQDPQLRNAVLALGPEVSLESGVVVKLQPQRDPKTKEEVANDLFAAWGRKVEEKTPVSEIELLSCIEKLCDTASASGEASEDKHSD
eukprot:TRINITY_DN13838_c0_g2_i1.p1 TRINITY_DN13838_c0_g2~~TRINITY_DN13838_c0_g2_i1.p1  ORF type:complete len:367 (-),score=92.29 TRINITY_DN13838_c0_g2_i1:316-1416(-)